MGVGWKNVFLPVGDVNNSCFAVHQRPQFAVDYPRIVDVAGACVESFADFGGAAYCHVPEVGFEPTLYAV